MAFDSIFVLCHISFNVVTLASPVETEKFQPSLWTAQFPLVSFVRQRQGKVMYWNNSTSIWQKATISYHITSVQPHDKFPKFCFVVSFGVARLNSCGRELLRQNILSQHCKELWQTGTQAASLVESVITSCNTSLLIFHNMITSLEMVSVRHVYKFIYILTFSCPKQFQQASQYSVGSNPPAWSLKANTQSLARWNRRKPDGPKNSETESNLAHYNYNKSAEAMLEACN